MWKWMFSKVVKMREKVALDLGEEDAEKPFLEHLEDLRVMLIRMASTLAIFVVATFAFYNHLWAVVTYPIHMAGLEGKITFQEMNPVGGFMAIMNLSIVGGIVMSSPLLLYFLMQFVLPGLRHTEKKVLWPALAVGGGLFLAGACFAFFIVVPKALQFFYEFNTGLTIKANGGKMPDPPLPLIWGIAQYVKFVCQFILIFGMCFELPVVVMALVKLDILSYKIMKGSRSWAMIGIAVVSAIVAPSPDVMTLGLIAGPLYFLYEICIWLAWYMDKRDRELYPEFYKEEEEDQKALEASDEWDNENYNPWGDDSSEEEEMPAPRPAPAGTLPIGGEPAATPTESVPEVTPPAESPSTTHPEESSSAAPVSTEPSVSEPADSKAEESKPAESGAPAPEPATPRVEDPKAAEPAPDPSQPEPPKPDPDHPNPPPGHPHF